MARPQSFERSTVLSQALGVFWAKGYNDASIQDLVDATGLNRGSLYNSFGDKAELFAEVMRLYVSQSPTQLLIKAPEDANVHHLLTNFFQSLVDRAQSDPDHKGCLMTNTAAGFYGCSAAMSQSVRDSLSGMEVLFVKLISQGQRRGEISTQVEPLKLARFFISAALGINVLARTQADQSVLQDIADVTLLALN